MRDRILAMLLNNPGDYISGEKISRKIGVTRSAIWKNIKALKEEGYNIQSVSNRGYCLMNVPDTIDSMVLRSVIDTRVLGRRIESHTTIGSTNARAKELAQLGAEEGTLVIAEEQKTGRGRLGRVWESPPGTGLWMSLVIRPSIFPGDAPKITTITSYSICKAIREATGLEAYIKWPNDIVVNGKKVCGILTEMQADPDFIDFIVVGMGINVNTEYNSFPEEIRQRATSIAIEKGEKVARRDILKVVLKELEKQYYKYIQCEDFEDILKLYRKYSVTIGKKVQVMDRNHFFEGEAIDIDNEACLLVKLNDGTIERVISGDVSVRGLYGYV